MNKRKGVLILAAVGVLALLAGCGGPKPPEVAALRFHAVQMKLMGGTAKLDLRLGNDNADPITVVGMKTTMNANGQSFAEGRQNINVSIPPYGSRDVTIEMLISNLGLVQSLIGVGKRGSLDYDMVSTVTFEDEGGRQYTKPVKRRGNVGIYGLR